MKALIKEINEWKKKYCLITNNCQHFAKALALYARRIIEKADVILLLFEKDDAAKLLVHLGLVCTGATTLELFNIISKYF